MSLCISVVGEKQRCEEHLSASMVISYHIDFTPHIFREGGTLFFLFGGGEINYPWKGERQTPKKTTQKIKTT